MERINQYKVAVVQAGAEVMDKEKGIKKTIKLLEEAAENNAKIIVFPEAFIPAYPRGMSFGTVVGIRSEEGRKDFLNYWKNSIKVPGPETEEIGEAVKKAGAYVVIGVIEKDDEYSQGTLYCTALFFGPNGELLGKHRKLKPTGTERLIWGEGDGSTMPVFDTPYGRIGSLICWENYMPLARAAMYTKGVQIYIAPTADARDTWFASMRHIAAEGRCFVLSCNQYSTKIRIIDIAIKYRFSSSDSFTRAFQSLHCITTLQETWSRIYFELFPSSNYQPDRKTRNLVE